MKRRRRGKGGGGVRILFPLWPEGEGRRPSKLVSSFAQHMGGWGFEFPPPYGQKVDGGRFRLGSESHIAMALLGTPIRMCLGSFVLRLCLVFNTRIEVAVFGLSWPLGAGKGSGHCGDRLKISPTTAWTHSRLVDFWNAILESCC